MSSLSTAPDLGEQFTQEAGGAEIIDFPVQPTRLEFNNFQDYCDAAKKHGVPYSTGIPIAASGGFANIPTYPNTWVLELK